MTPLRILLIDNYDSYTHNLSHLLAVSNASIPPLVVRADAFPSLVDLRRELGLFDAHVVSPGPGTPHSFRDLTQLARDVLADPDTPVLGVCLGMQAMCAIRGAHVTRAPDGPVHGRRSKVVLGNHGMHCPLLVGLPAHGFWVVRYHSLVVLPQSLPQEILPCAWTSEEIGTKAVLMAVRHRQYPHYGVQFHPESVQTEFGSCIAGNFIYLVTRHFACRALPSRSFAAGLRIPRCFSFIRSETKKNRLHAPKQSLRMLHRRISNLAGDSADVYNAIFRHSEEAFWLDSSSSTAVSRSMSRCSSPDVFESDDFYRHPDLEPSLREDGPSDTLSSNSQRGRVSIMGDLRGPRAELITYAQAEKKVRVRAYHIDDMHESWNSSPQHVSDSVETESEHGRLLYKSETRIWKEYPSTTIFDFLKNRLAERHLSHSISAFEYEDMLQEESSEFLPLEFRGGYVGYCGYEVKEDVDGTMPNRHCSAVPDAWYVFADRVIVFDHFDNSAYLIAVISECAPLTCEGNRCRPSKPLPEVPSEVLHQTITPSEELAMAIQWFGDTERCLRQMDAARSFSRSQAVVSLAKERTASAGVENFERCEIDSQLQPSPNRQLLRFSLERCRELYKQDIRRCLELINAGESYEICLTNRLRTVLPEAKFSTPLDIYNALRVVNPAPYSAFLRLDKDTAICCSSPEKFLQISSSGVIVSKPIKGTRPRGSSLHQDRIFAADLQTSVKDCSENLMIVDLVRNDLSRVCAVGSVKVPKLMSVETYASVHQLVSTVQGQLSWTSCAVDCIREAFPMGSMTGAPKVRTMALIDELEWSARGVYSGTIGYMSLCGAVNLNVVIRTAVLQGPNVEIGVGGAIVALSSPDEEYEEILVKGRPLMETIALVATGSTDFILTGSGRCHRNCESVMTK